HVSALPGAVLPLAPDGVLPDGAEGGGGVRDGRRRHADPGAAPDRAADRHTRTRLRGALRLHPVVERVHLRAHLHVLVGASHRERRRDERTDSRGYLLLGIVDGGCGAWTGPDRRPLRLLPRLLRLGAHGRRRKVIGDQPSDEAASAARSERASGTVSRTIDATTPSVTVTPAASLRRP